MKSLEIEISDRLKDYVIRAGKPLAPKSFIGLAAERDGCYFVIRGVHTNPDPLREDFLIIDVSLKDKYIFSSGDGADRIDLPEDVSPTEAIEAFSEAFSGHPEIKEPLGSPYVYGIILDDKAILATILFSKIKRSHKN